LPAGKRLHRRSVFTFQPGFVPQPDSCTATKGLVINHLISRSRAVSPYRKLDQLSGALGAVSLPLPYLVLGGFADPAGCVGRNTKANVELKTIL
jgi:hypothetical protein